ncbi:MAG: hypothetical protein JJU23_00935 [Cyclobacteriaceae bacterium]|nr:hypothetical protein [Cyclobacteriaceae bacterium]
MTALVFFTSCSEDDEEALPESVTFTFTTEPSLNASGDVEVMVGTQINVILAINAPAGFATARLVGGNNLNETITKNDSEDDQVLANTKVTFTIDAPSVVNTTPVTLEVSDDLGNIAVQTFNIITTAPAIDSRTQLVFVAQNNSREAGFYSVIEDVKRNISDARENSASVDFTYFFSTATGIQAGLGAIDSEVTAVTFSLASANISNFPIKNSTRFAPRIVSESDFNAINDEVQLLAAADPATIPSIDTSSGQEIFNLEVGAVVAFRLDAENGRASKVGLIRVTDISPGINGSITIDLKVQI